MARSKPVRRATKAKARARPAARPKPKARATGAKVPARKRSPAKRGLKPRTGAKRGAKRGTGRKRIAAAKWVRLVEKHGLMLASARGPIPNVAEAVAGAPIIGGWWAHPKGKAIFAALSEIDDSDDIRCFKLIDGKITFVHRRMWPGLVRLGRDGAIAVERLAAVQQEHLPTGEHRNFVTVFPDWVDDATARAADALTSTAARALIPGL